MSSLTILIATTEALFKTLEKRIEVLEIAIKPDHGFSMYAKGCRCEVCRQVKTKAMREYRKRKKPTTNGGV